ncbi:MAG: hypothetical protein M5U34_42840 [Chloroflexi bacterium]|nr:hypothetical protein [Chloroflexota bacterium]
MVGVGGGHFVGHYRHGANIRPGGRFAVGGRRGTDGVGRAALAGLMLVKGAGGADHPGRVCRWRWRWRGW